MSKDHWTFAGFVVLIFMLVGITTVASNNKDKAEEAQKQAQELRNSVYDPALRQGCLRATEAAVDAFRRTLQERKDSFLYIAKNRRLSIQETRTANGFYTDIITRAEVLANMSQEGLIDSMVIQRKQVFDNTCKALDQ
jgi:hypothetical protein